MGLVSVLFFSFLFRYGLRREVASETSLLLFLACFSVLVILLHAFPEIVFNLDVHLMLSMNFLINGLAQKCIIESTHRSNQSLRSRFGSTSEMGF